MVYYIITSALSGELKNSWESVMRTFTVSIQRNIKYVKVNPV